MIVFCPICYSKEVRVLDSRPYLDENQIRRRRQCSSCSYRFSTTEVVDFGLPKVMKKSGISEEFKSQKVRQSILRSVEKRNMSVGQIDQLTGRVVHRINSLQVKHLLSNQIGCMIMEELKGVDVVAMIRYASVFYDFNDALSFKQYVDDAWVGCQTSDLSDEREKV